VAVALGTGAVYVANPGTDTVSVLDPATGSVRQAIKAGWQPVALALSPDGKRLYSADRASSSVTAIDVATGTVAATIAVAGGPVALAHHPTQQHLYVACSTSGSVAVLDTAALSVGATLAAGNGPTALAVTPNGNEVWLALGADHKIIILSTAPFQVAATIALPQPPQGIALSPDGARGYVTFPATGQFAVLNVAARTAGPLLAVGPGAVPGAVARDAAGTVYIAASTPVGGRIFAFQADGTAAGSVGIGRQPAGMAVTDTLLAVANTADNTVSLLDPRRIGAAGPGAPPLLLSAPLGSGLGERLSWAVRNGPATQAALNSTTTATTALRALRAGPALVSAVYTLRDNPDPYTFEIRLNPALEAANAVMRKDQYDLAMNILNTLHPVGVEVMTRALRDHVIELRNQEFDPFPAYTFPDYRGRGPLPRRQ
jgi:YVTN family beta-propeller protein